MNFHLGFKLSNWSKYVYSLYLFGTNLTFGIIFAFFPAIMVDMKYIMGTTLTLISIHPVLETVGYTLGAFVGLTYKWLNRQLVMAIWFIIICAVSAGTPLVGELWLLYLFALILGFGSSINVSGYIVWTIEQWKDKSAPVLQTNALGFGLGSVICSSILGPYLTGEVRQERDESPDNTSLVNPYIEITAEERRDKLFIPSVILCAVLCIVPIISLVTYLIEPYKHSKLEPKTEVIEVEESKQSQESKESTKLFDNDLTPKTWIRILMAFWFTFYVLSETMYLKFAIAYYQYCPHHLTAEDAAKLFSYSTISYSVFRLSNVFITMKFTINTIIKIHYFVLVVGMFLTIVAEFNYICLWISGPIIMWGFSPMFAGTYTFAAKYLTMSDQMSTVFLFLRGVFTLFTPSIIGEFIENYSYVFPLVIVVYIVSSLILFIFINFLINKYQNLLKFQNKLTN